MQGMMKPLLVLIAASKTGLVPHSKCIRLKYVPRRASTEQKLLKQSDWKWKISMTKTYWLFLRLLILRINSSIENSYIRSKDIVCALAIINKITFIMVKFFFTVTEMEITNTQKKILVFSQIVLWIILISDRFSNAVLKDPESNLSFWS